MRAGRLLAATLAAVVLIGVELGSASHARAAFGPR